VGEDLKDMTHWYELRGYDTTGLGDDPSDTEIDDKDRHRVHRRNGVVIYKRHKCTNAKCHAGRERCIAWIRTNGTDKVLIEQCQECLRTTSWSYEGVAPKEWRSKVQTFKPRDAQKQALYKWERKHVDKRLWEPTMSKGDVLALVDKISETYRIPTPKVTLSETRYGTSWAHGMHRIRLVKNHRCVTVVIHEMAHIVHNHIMHQNCISQEQAKALQPGVTAVTREAGHGPTYVAVYIVMLETFAGLKATDLLATCKSLKVRTLSEIPTLLHVLTAQDRRARAEEKVQA
jgi:hypothetical protein